MEDRFFQQGVDQETHPKDDAPFDDAYGRRQRALRWALGATLGALCLTAIAVQISTSSQEDAPGSTNAPAVPGSSVGSAPAAVPPVVAVAAAPVAPPVATPSPAVAATSAVVAAAAAPPVATTAPAAATAVAAPTVSTTVPAIGAPPVRTAPAVATTTLASAAAKPALAPAGTAIAPTAKAALTTAGVAPATTAAAKPALAANVAATKPALPAPTPATPALAALSARPSTATAMATPPAPASAPAKAGPTIPPLPPAHTLTSTAVMPAVAPTQTTLEQICRTAFDHKKYKDVVDNCARAFEARPQAGDLAAYVAEVEFNRGRVAQALTWGQKAAAANPNLADAYVFIGGAEQQAGHGAAAKAAYLKYLQLAPNGRFANDLRAAVRGL